MKDVILTHCGKLGDMLYSLPVAAWIHRTRGQKIHWVLPRCFDPFQYIAPLLLAQDTITAAVTLSNHQVTSYDCGGQPYRFEPGVNGAEYYNLGFRHYPNRFIPEFYAEEHGLGCDPDFTLRFGGLQVSDKIYRTREGAMARLMPDAEPLPPMMDLLQLTRMLAGAKEVHSWFCGIAVLTWLARIPCHVYRVDGHAPMGLYFPDPRTLIIHEVSL